MSNTPIPDNPVKPRSGRRDYTEHRRPVAGTLGPVTSVALDVTEIHA
jgi:hypothetical protein